MKNLSILFLIGIFLLLSGCKDNPSVFSEKYPVYYKVINGIEIRSSSPIPPPQSKWAYEIITSSYLYYAQQCEQTKDGVTIKNYWVTEFQDSKAYWVFKKEILFFSKAAYGDVKVNWYP